MMRVEVLQKKVEESEARSKERLRAQEAVTGKSLSSDALCFSFLDAHHRAHR